MKYSLDYSSFVSCLWCPSFSCAILVQIPFFFFSTVSFSNEDNHCQLYATLDFVKFIVSICEQTNNLSFTDKSAFWTSHFFFSKSCLKVGGAAYTRVRLIHESLRYLGSIQTHELCDSTWCSMRTYLHIYLLFCQYSS